MKAIVDGAEISVAFPNKTYHGTFTRHSGFSVRADEAGAHIRFEQRGGDHRRVDIHIHYYLLADLITELGEALGESRSQIDPHHSENLLSRVEQLRDALASKTSK